MNYGSGTADLSLALAALICDCTGCVFLEGNTKFIDSICARQIARIIFPHM